MEPDELARQDLGLPAEQSFDFSAPQAPGWEAPQIQKFLIEPGGKMHMWDRNSWSKDGSPYYHEDMIHHLGLSADALYYGDMNAGYVEPRHAGAVPSWFVYDAYGTDLTPEHKQALVAKANERTNQQLPNYHDVYTDPFDKTSEFDFSEQPAAPQEPAPALTEWSDPEQDQKFIIAPDGKLHMWDRREHSGSDMRYFHAPKMQDLGYNSDDLYGSDDAPSRFNAGYVERKPFAGDYTWHPYDAYGKELSREQIDALVAKANERTGQNHISYLEALGAPKREAEQALDAQADRLKQQYESKTAEFDWSEPSRPDEYAPGTNWKLMWHIPTQRFHMWPTNGYGMHGEPHHFQMAAQLGHPDPSPPDPYAPRLFDNYVQGHAALNDGKAYVQVYDRGHVMPDVIRNTREQAKQWLLKQGIPFGGHLSKTASEFGDFDFSTPDAPPPAGIPEVPRDPRAPTPGPMTGQDEQRWFKWLIPHNEPAKWGDNAWFWQVDGPDGRPWHADTKRAVRPEWNRSRFPNYHDNPWADYTHGWGTVGPNDDRMRVDGGYDEGHFPALTQAGEAHGINSFHAYDEMPRSYSDSQDTDEDTDDYSSRSSPPPDEWSVQLNNSELTEGARVRIMSTGEEGVVTNLGTLAGFIMNDQGGKVRFNKNDVRVLERAPSTPSTTAKTAAGQVMYHVAPSEHRESLMANGLPRGAYLSLNPSVYTHMFNELDRGDAPGTDRWQVEADPADMIPDESGDPTEDFVIQRPIPPDRLRRVSTHDNRDYVKLGGYWDRSGPQPKWVNGPNPVTVPQSPDDLLGYEDNCYEAAAGLVDDYPGLRGTSGLHDGSPHAWAVGHDGTIYDPARWTVANDDAVAIIPRDDPRWHAYQSSNDKTSMKLADSYYDNEAPWFIDKSGKLHVGNWGQLHSDIGAGNDFQVKGVVQKSGAVTVFSSYDDGWGEAIDKPAVYNQVAPQLEMQLGIKVHEVGEADWADQALGGWDLPSMPPKQASEEFDWSEPDQPEVERQRAAQQTWKYLYHIPSDQFHIWPTSAKGMMGSPHHFDMSDKLGWPDPRGRYREDSPNQIAQQPTYYDYVQGDAFSHRADNQVRLNTYQIMRNANTEARQKAHDLARQWFTGQGHQVAPDGSYYSHRTAEADDWSEPNAPGNVGYQSPGSGSFKFLYHRPSDQYRFWGGGENSNDYNFMHHGDVMEQMGIPEEDHWGPNTVPGYAEYWHNAVGEPQLSIEDARYGPETIEPDLAQRVYEDMRKHDPTFIAEYEQHMKDHPDWYAKHPESWHTAADAGQLQDFFEQAAQGQRAPVNPLGPEDLSHHPEHIDWRNAWQQHAGPFDHHIETSIPGYAQNMTVKGTALMKAFPGSSVLDIAASHGSFGKTLSQLGGMYTTSLDPSPEFRDQFHTTPVEGAEYSQTAFGPGFTDNYGQTIESYPHENKHDIVHESMAFQFIDPDRDSQIAQVKHHLNPSGLAIFDEKFNQSDPDKYWANEAKKDKWKLKHYPQDALDAKTEEVGLKGEGMGDMQANYDDFHSLLQEHFKFVSPYWKSGNFAGFAASDNPNTLKKYLDAYGQEAQAASKAPVAAPNAMGGVGQGDEMGERAAGLRTAQEAFDFSAPFNPNTGEDDHGTWDWKSEVPEHLPYRESDSAYFHDRAPWMMENNGHVRMGKFGDFHEDLWPGFETAGEDEDEEGGLVMDYDAMPYARGAIYPRNGQFVNVVYTNRGIDPYQDNLYEGQQEKTREAIRRSIEKTFGHPLVHPEGPQEEVYGRDYADSGWADNFPGQEKEVKRWGKTADWDFADPIQPMEENRPGYNDRARWLYNHQSGKAFLYPDNTDWGGHHNQVFESLKEQDPESWPGMFGYARKYPDTSGMNPDQHRLTEGGYFHARSYDPSLGPHIMNTFGGDPATPKAKRAVLKAWQAQGGWDQQRLGMAKDAMPYHNNTWYHVTPQSYLPSIAERGLVPQTMGSSAPNWPGVERDNRAVYLHQNLDSAQSMAKMALRSRGPGADYWEGNTYNPGIPNWPMIDGKPDKPAILRVRGIDRNQVVPDPEDFQNTIEGWMQNEAEGINHPLHSEMIEDYRPRPEYDEDEWGSPSLNESIDLVNHLHQNHPEHMRDLTRGLADDEGRRTMMLGGHVHPDNIEHVHLPTTDDWHEGFEAEHPGLDPDSEEYYDRQNEYEENNPMPPEWGAVHGEYEDDPESGADDAYAQYAHYTPLRDYVQSKWPTWQRQSAISDTDDTDWGHANAPERVDPKLLDSMMRSNWLERIPYAMYDDGSTEIGKFGQMHYELPGGSYGSRKRSIVRGGIYPRGKKWVHAIYTNGGTKLEGDPDFGEELKLGVDPATVTSKLSQEFGRPIELATGENEAASSGWGYKAGDPDNFDFSEPMQPPGQKTAGSREDFAGAPGWASVPKHVYDWLDRMYPSEQHGIESDCLNPKCNHDWTDEERHELAQYGEVKCPVCGLLQNREGGVGGASMIDSYAQGPYRPGGGTRVGLTMKQQADIGEQIIDRIGELPSGQITKWWGGSGQYNHPVDFHTMDEHGNPWGIEVKTFNSQGQPRIKLGTAADVQRIRDHCAQNALRPGVCGVRLNYYTDKADVFFRPQLTDPYASDRTMTHVGSVDFGDLNPFKTPAGENQVPEQPVAVGFGDDVPF